MGLVELRIRYQQETRGNGGCVPVDDQDHVGRSYMSLISKLISDSSVTLVTVGQSA